MFLKIIYFFILIHDLFVNSQDIEVEGMFRFGDSFLNKIKNNLFLNMRSKNDGSSLGQNDLSSKSRENIKSPLKTEPNLIKTIELNYDNHNLHLSKDIHKNINVDSNKQEPIKNNKKHTVVSHDEDKSKNKSDAAKFKQNIKRHDIKRIKRVKRSIDNNGLNIQQLKKHRYSKRVTKPMVLHSKNTNNSNKNYQFKKKDISEKTKDYVLKRDVRVNLASNKKEVHLKDDEINEHFNKVFTIRALHKQNYNARVKSYLSKDNPQVKQFLKIIIYDEVENIETIAGRLQEKIVLEKPVFLSLVEKTSDSYSMKMKRYVSYAINQEPTTDIDREYLYLDIVASSNMLLYSEERKLFNTMVNIKKDNLTEDDLKTLKEELYKEHVHHKKRQMFFICEKLQICRAYPGFSDYFAELTREILKLSDDHLETIIEIITELIKKRTHFFKSFMKDYVAVIIGEKLEVLSKDLDDFRDMFSILWSIITQRFKLMKTTDNELRTKTKAVRILIDIIDKSFSVGAGDDLTVMTFDTALKAIRHWVLGLRDKIDIPIKLLLEHVVSVFRYNWDQNIRSEVAMLTEVMMTGKTDLTDIYKKLFSKGSLFVKYDIINSD